MASRELKTEFRGTSYDGRLFWDENATSSRPGVLFIHEAVGFGEKVLSDAERLADEEGFTVYAFDFFGKTPDNYDGMMEIIGELLGDLNEFDGRLESALSTLSSQVETDSSNVAGYRLLFWRSCCIGIG